MRMDPFFWTVITSVVKMIAFVTIIQVDLAL